jgi:ribosomal protein L37E
MDSYLGQKEGEKVNLKACNRCGGDMIIEELLGDVEIVCLQCGHRTFAPAADQPRYRIVRRQQPGRARRVPAKRAA